MPVPIQIRKAEPSDFGFVANKWLCTYWRFSKIKSYLDYEYFVTKHSKLIKDNVDLNPDFVLSIACDPKLPEHIYAFLAGERGVGCDVLHYMFTKPPFRQLGIANELIDDFKKNDRLIYTHRLPKHQLNGISFSDCMIKKWPESKYDPYKFLEMLND